MKTLTIFLAVILCSVLLYAQPQPASTVKPTKITDNSIIKDSSGNIYPAAVWRKLLATGKYTLKADIKGGETQAYILTRLTDEQFARKMENLPKPKESSSFTTGKKFYPIIARDIDGKKVNTKKLAGKIIVINFWFIKCPPCIMEMPELNKLTEDFRNDSSVAFIAVALDDESSLKEFLHSTKFNYTVIGDGRMIASDYKINSYPTNLVVSPEGHVYFHASGYSGIATTHWLKKSILELKENMTGASNKSSAENDDSTTLSVQGPR